MRTTDTTKLIWDRDSCIPPLKQLANIVELQQNAKHPSVPPHARVKPVFRDNTANELTRSIIAFFKTQGGFAERINNMGQHRERNGQFIWVKTNGRNGTADIAATFEGKSIKVEVKAGNDKQREAQKDYQREVEAAGGVYIIARNFDGFLYEFFKAVEGFANGN